MILGCSDAHFRKVVQSATSVADVIRKLNRALVGSNYALIRQELRRLHLDTNHWKAGIAPRSRRALKVDEALAKNSPHNTGVVKKLILRMGLLPYQCQDCGLGPQWRSLPLILRLDHKNGRSRDHRLENLRFLCPNCDSQTDTFCGRNKRGRSQAVPKFCACGAGILSRSVCCRSCSRKNRPTQATKIVWPSPAELQQLLTTHSFEAVARHLGVSSNAIRKRLRLSETGPVSSV